MYFGDSFRKTIHTPKCSIALRNILACSCLFLEALPERFKSSAFIKIIVFHITRPYHHIAVVCLSTITVNFGFLETQDVNVVFQHQMDHSLTFGSGRKSAAIQRSYPTRLRAPAYQYSVILGLPCAPNGLSIQRKTMRRARRHSHQILAKLCVRIDSLLKTQKIFTNIIDGALVEVLVVGP